jgi:hypothetical protein
MTSTQSRASIRLSHSDTHLVPLPAELDGDGGGAHRVRGDEHHALAGDEDGVDTDRRAVSSLCEHGNNVESAAE